MIIGVILLKPHDSLFGSLTHFFALILTLSVYTIEVLEF